MGTGAIFRCTTLIVFLTTNSLPPWTLNVRANNGWHKRAGQRTLGFLGVVTVFKCHYKARAVVFATSPRAAVAWRSLQLASGCVAPRVLPSSVGAGGERNGNLSLILSLGLKSSISILALARSTAQVSLTSLLASVVSSFPAPAPTGSHPNCEYSLRFESPLSVRLVYCICLRAVAST